MNKIKFYKKSIDTLINRVKNVTFNDLFLSINVKMNFEVYKIDEDCHIVGYDPYELIYKAFGVQKIFTFNSDVGVVPVVATFIKYKPIIGFLYLDLNNTYQLYFPIIEDNNFHITNNNEHKLILKEDFDNISEFPNVKNVFKYFTDKIEIIKNKYKITCTKTNQEKLLKDEDFCIQNDCPYPIINCEKCKEIYIDWEIIEED